MRETERGRERERERQRETETERQRDRERDTHTHKRDTERGDNTAVGFFCFKHPFPDYYCVLRQASESCTLYTSLSVFIALLCWLGFDSMVSQLGAAIDRKTVVAIPLPPLPLPPVWLLFLARRSIDSLKSRRSRLVDSLKSRRSRLVGSLKSRRSRLVGSLKSRRSRRVDSLKSRRSRLFGSLKSRRSRRVDSLKSRRSRLVGPGTCSIRIHKTRSIPLAVFLSAVLSSCGDFRMRVVGVSWFALLAYVRFSCLIVEAVV